MTPFARKRFGQHFLVDQRALVRIVETLAPTAGEPVLEIGPGRGALTGPLIARAGRIGAVELDRDLAEKLRRNHDPSCLRLWEQDVLELDLASALHDLASDRGQRLAVVGNLPYNVSKPVAMKLVRERGAVNRAVLMFQREVASRLVARPGSRAYGPLTVLVGQSYSVESCFDLAPGSFRPRPAVISTVTLWKRRESELREPADDPRLRLVLATCFAQRRRTLRNNLRTVLGGAARAEALLEEAGVDPLRRAEQLEPAEFLALARLWPLV